ncbi:sodium/hydrogen exchanger 9B2-like isoform X2 [Biomphalaria glabrata]|nr:sodium/hydrogen exchanger 9B2-like isoform X2 [Biomphalaria glabrata]XP_055877525.1 sodium/hydrogen exchanger 9B2-like isoform X2 [Biomphalaria glabrata]
MMVPILDSEQECDVQSTVNTPIHSDPYSADSLDCDSNSKSPSYFDSVSSSQLNGQSKGDLNSANTDVYISASCSCTNKDKVKHSRCDYLKSFSRHLLASHHPLPEKANRFRVLAHGFLCPPSGKVGAVLLVIVLFAMWWATLLSIAKMEVMPGGSLFPMLIMFIAAWCAGYIVKHTVLPPLVGMLVVGAILGNVEGINVAKQIQSSWSSTARSIALSVILTRAGLGLDPVALKKLSWVVFRLAFGPSLLECITCGLLARFVLDFPWTWAFMLGFVMAVVSPAVVVPLMLNLSERGYGLNKGIPTLIIAACSLDSVLAVTGFGVLLDLAFTQDNLVWGIIKGPLEAVVGVSYGVVVGLLLWYIPQRHSKNLVLFRSALLIGAALLAIFGSKILDWSGSGPLGCITVSFVAAHGWRKDYQEKKTKNPVEDVAAVLWMLFMPLLFSLIGAAVDFSSLEIGSVGIAIGILFAGLFVRVVTASLTTCYTDLNKKERLFVSIAWIPKATVQAAIGAVAYDTAVEKGAQQFIPLGKKILNQAVLAILIAAPLGSALIALLGPRLLHKTEDLHGDIQKESQEQSQTELGHVNEAFEGHESIYTRL